MSRQRHRLSVDEQKPAGIERIKLQQRLPVCTLRRSDELPVVPSLPVVGILFAAHFIHRPAVRGAEEIAHRPRPPETRHEEISPLLRKRRRGLLLLLAERELPEAVETDVGTLAALLPERFGKIPVVQLLRGDLWNLPFREIDMIRINNGCPHSNQYTKQDPLHCIPSHFRFHAVLPAYQTHSNALPHQFPFVHFSNCSCLPVAATCPSAQAMLTRCGL